MERPVLVAASVGMAAIVVLVGGCRESGAGGRSTPDAGTDTTIKLPSPDASCVGTTDAGAPCPADSCGGVLKSLAALKTGEVAESGPANPCPAGKVCVAVAPTATGDGLYLSCVVAHAGAAAFGMPCTRDGAAATRCADDSLCLEAAGGAFCGSLCRIDSDCPADAFCLEYKTAPLPNLSYALVGQCTPRAKVAALSTSTLCRAEADCQAGQGCRMLGPRTTLQTCVPGGPKSLGAPCASGTECRSGECLDEAFRFASAASRAACAGVCWKNSDCGASQRCVRQPLADNATTTNPLDDVVVGMCRTLLTADPDDACADDQACKDRKAGDSCDPVTGLCFTRTAPIGAPCKQDADCGAGANCQTGPRFKGGACVASGCAAGATMGVDACPGDHSVCAQRASDAPVFRCYERCAVTGDCSRVAEGYQCGGQDQPINICLFDQGN